MIHLSVIYDTTRNSAWPGAYSVAMSDADESPRPLRQKGPVWNNRTTYTGVFRTRSEAAKAAMECINTPCVLWESQNLMGGYSEMHVTGLTDKLRPAIGYANRVLARRTPHGLFVAAD